MSLVLILWAIHIFSTGELRFSKSPLQIPLLATIIYGIFQIIPFGYTTIADVENIPKTISADPFATKLAVIHFFALLVYFAALLTYTDSVKRLRKLVLLVIIFGSIYAFYAIIQSVISPGKIYGIYESKFAQPFGSFVNRHSYAAFIEMSIAMTLGILFAGAVSKDKRLLYLTATGLMAVSLLLSGSRGGLIAFLSSVMFLIFITTDTNSKAKLALKFALVLTFLIAVIAGTILVGGESTLTRIVETTQSQDITTNRIHIWSVTLKVISSSPIFGVGLGAFPQAYTKFDSLSGLERVEQAHNDYLQILADAGIFGLIFAGLFALWLFRAGFQNIKTENKFRRAVAVGALSGCFAIFVHSIFDFVLHVTAISLLFLTLTAIVVLSGQKFPDDEPETPRKRRRKRQVAEKIPINPKIQSHGETISE